MLNFANKVVVITGASAGVGADCARVFAAQGAKLVLAARGEEALEVISTELSKVTQVSTLAIDVGIAEDCTHLIKHALETFGKIHVLVNNAGCHFRGDFNMRSAEQVAAMADVNFRAPIQLSAEALPHIQKEGGAIVMVGSLAGLAPLQGAATYSATKSGLRAFTHALADELRGSNVSVGIVSPGPIDTGFIMDHIDQVEDIVYSQPMSSSKQVADAVLSVAKGERLEIAMPAISAKLTLLSYLFPRLRRATRPMLYKIGRRNKKKYRKT